MMKTVCVAGKNNIAVDVLNYLKSRNDINICCIPDRCDDGVDLWQRSLRKYAVTNNITIIDLEQAYDIENLIFISTEFDRIVKTGKFKDARLFNIHFSLLPKYKGMFTSVLPILHGESETGVSLHVIRDGIDTGEIIAQKKIVIDSFMNSNDLYKELIKYGSNLVIENMNSLLSGDYVAETQSVNGSSYFSKTYIDYNNLSLDINATAWQIHNQIRAFAFRPYQFIKAYNSNIRGSEMTSEVSSLKAGTVLSENDISIKIATIDYNLILYKDTLARIEKSIRERDYEQLLLNCAYKPIINDQNNTGRTPLMLAVQCNNEEAVDYLINNGAHISITDYSGNNLFYYAMQGYNITKDDRMIKKVADFGISILDRNYDGFSVLDLFDISCSQLYKMING